MGRKIKEENACLLTTYYAFSTMLGAFYILRSFVCKQPFGSVGVTLLPSLDCNSTKPMTHSMAILIFHHSYQCVSLASHTQLEAFFEGRHN